MESDLLHYLDTLRAHPALLLLVLGLVSFIWADFAVVCGAVLASQDFLPAPALAIFLLGMIFVGDSMLYGLGRYASSLPFVKARTGGEKSQKISALLHRNFFESVFFSRFVPALRVPTYMLIGALAIPFFKFTKYVMGIIIIWSGSLFILAFGLGDYAYVFIEKYKLTAVIIIAATMWLLPRTIAYTINKKDRL